MTLFSFQLETTRCPTCGQDFDAADSLLVQGISCNLDGEEGENNIMEFAGANMSLILENPSPTIFCRKCDRDLSPYLSDVMESA